MLILVPPSEGKQAPEAGARLVAKDLSYPGLTPVRTRIRRALIDLCAKHPQRAQAVLGLGSTQAGLIAANAGIDRAAAAPAIEIYTGVLYEAWDFASLPATARRRADKRIAITSALFGLISPSDRIPAYRLSADCSLPGIGPLAGAWRDAIGRQLAETKGLILDMRSGAYVALGPVPAERLDATASVRVLLEKSGRRSVVSHHNKATKGRIVRAALATSTQPTRVDQLIDYFADLGFRSELHNDRGHWRVDVVIDTI